MSPPLTVVVWDVDDTLYLEREYVRSGFVAVGAHFADTMGVSGFDRVLWELFERGVRRSTFNAALESLGIAESPQLIAELVDVYRSHKPDIELLPDARDALARCAALGLRQSALTDGPAVSQNHKVAALGLRGWCEPVVVTAELGPGLGKPAPDGFERIEREAGAARTQLIYVADNPAKDFVAPRNLGWRTLRIRRPGGLHAEVVGGGADLERADLVDFPDCVF